MLRNFINSEAGAVTVDWGILTAGVVALGMATYSTFGETIMIVATGINATILGPVN